jgi:hypothetical protein
MVSQIQHIVLSMELRILWHAALTWPTSSHRVRPVLLCGFCISPHSFPDYIENGRCCGFGARSFKGSVGSLIQLNTSSCTFISNAYYELCYSCSR